MSMSKSMIIGTTPTGEPVYYIMPEVTNPLVAATFGMILGAPGCGRDGLVYDD